MEVDQSPAHDAMDADDDDATANDVPKSDSWDDHSESATPSTTPDEEEAETFVPASKPRTKVKPKPEEALTTEKEHVNVVFIGHVGKLDRWNEKM
jgi:hypothetical protein